MAEKLAEAGGGREEGSRREAEGSKKEMLFFCLPLPACCLPSFRACWQTFRGLRIIVHDADHIPVRRFRFSGKEQPKAMRPCVKAVLAALALVLSLAGVA